MHKNAETRRGLQPLAELAQRVGAAVLGVAHFTKSSQTRDPLDRVSGSLAFGAAPRLVLGAVRDRTDETGERRLFVRIKSNIGPDGGGFEYRLRVPDPLPGVQTVRVDWGQAVEGHARDIVAAAEPPEEPDDRSARDNAAAFLRSLLGDGPIPVKVLRRDAEDAGHAWATIRRAAKALSVEPRKDR